MLAIGISGVVLAVIAFVVGSSYGRSAEQIIVAKVLSDEKATDAAVEKFVGRVLGSLKTEYTVVFDEIEADLAYWKGRI